MYKLLIDHSDGLVALLVKHLLEEVELSSSDHNNSYQFQNGEIFDLVLMACDDLGLNNLALLLEQFVLGYFLEALTHIDQLRMQFIDLALLGQLQQVCFVVGEEVDRD